MGGTRCHSPAPRRLRTHVTTNLGAMGFPMATQLLQNSSANLWIFDVDQRVLHRFASDAPDGRVRIATSAKQVADESVRKLIRCVPKLMVSGVHSDYCPCRSLFDESLSKILTRSHRKARQGGLLVARSRTPCREHVRKGLH